MREKDNGFMGMIKDGLGYVSQVIMASIVPPIADGAEVLMNNIEERISRLEKKIMRKIYSGAIIGFSAILLLSALFFFLIEYLQWSKTIAFLSIGIIILVTGLIIKLSVSDN